MTEIHDSSNDYWDYREDQEAKKKGYKDRYNMQMKESYKQHVKNSTEEIGILQVIGIIVVIIMILAGLW